MKVLHVAEKPSVAKKISQILSKGHYDIKRGISPTNPVYSFQYRLFNQNCIFVVTSVIGHLTELEFDPQFQNWLSVEPSTLFDINKSTIIEKIPEKMENVSKNLQREAKTCFKLVLWLDCDREGENIAFEVIKICSNVNNNFRIFNNNQQIINNNNVLRARFSELTPQAVYRAINNLKTPNHLDSFAVDCRKEIDLRIGAAFTRYQTIRLKPKFPGIIPTDDPKSFLSYGPCQFPTLGFVVERFLRIENFLKEEFWTITCSINSPNSTLSSSQSNYHSNSNSNSNSNLYFNKKNKPINEEVLFGWKRGHIFDKMTCLIIYEMCLNNPIAKVVNIQKSQEKRYRPYPLNTVFLQKLASRALRFTSAKTMSVAESLYNLGFISYPRTETTRYKTIKTNDFQKLVSEQANNNKWGNYANQLINIPNKYQDPKYGNSDDNAHPPIHPIKSIEGQNLSQDQKKLYELITRHFLASCSKDAVGFSTNITIEVCGEEFSANGVIIQEKNFLEIYIYQKWYGKEIPNFSEGQTFYPKSLLMVEGETRPPPLLTEAELIDLMDKNGIGTDATMHEHIKTIQKRFYATKVGNGFKPTKLGIALVKGYDSMGFQLSKPNIRSKMEADMNLISTGQKFKGDVLIENLKLYQKVFISITKQWNLLENEIKKHFSSIGNEQQSKTLKNNFSTCGKCNRKMKLKKQGFERFLKCEFCDEIYMLPKNGSLSPYEQQNNFHCPICNFQPISILNPKTKKSHTICPYCFSHPPKMGEQGFNDIEDSENCFLSGFRCFMCKNNSCPLSGSSSSLGSSSHTFVKKCGKCNEEMHLRKKKNGGIFIGCTGFKKGCRSSVWFSLEPESSSVSPEKCNYCNSHKISLIFPNEIKLPNGFPHKSTFCPFCDKRIQFLVSYSG